MQPPHARIGDMYFHNDSHQYRPPHMFQQAVMACPEMRSMDYLKAILANGSKGISRPGQRNSEM